MGEGTPIHESHQLVEAHFARLVGVKPIEYLLDHFGSSADCKERRWNEGRGQSTYFYEVMKGHSDFEKVRVFNALRYSQRLPECRGELVEREEKEPSSSNR